MTRTQIFDAIEQWPQSLRKEFLEAFQDRWCSDCGGELIECGCRRCATCGHFDKLACPCMAKLLADARDRREERRRAAETAQDQWFTAHSQGGGNGNAGNHKETSRAGQIGR